MRTAIYVHANHLHCRRLLCESNHRILVLQSHSRGSCIRPAWQSTFTTIHRAHQNRSAVIWIIYFFVVVLYISPVNLFVWNIIRHPPFFLSETFTFFVDCIVSQHIQLVQSSFFHLNPAHSASLMITREDIRHERPAKKKKRRTQTTKH